MYDDPMAALSRSAGLQAGICLAETRIFRKASAARLSIPPDKEISEVRLEASEDGQNWSPC
jgi:hypothetical protein